MNSESGFMFSSPVKIMYTSIKSLISNVVTSTALVLLPMVKSSILKGSVLIEFWPEYYIIFVYLDFINIHIMCAGGHLCWELLSCMSVSV